MKPNKNNNIIITSTITIGVRDDWREVCIQLDGLEIVLAKYPSTRLNIDDHLS